ncbi:hypothetical protein FJY63_01075 [Candidatus Sumerlaeota bacterium]|nr:hypothetical protein [Candidatus Sumerlaeota bacterium]
MRAQSLRSPNRRRNRPETRRLLVAVAVATAIILGLFGRQPSRALAQNTEPVVAKTATLEAAIRTGLRTQYENTVLLESNQPVPLLLDCNAPSFSSFDQRVRWSCDRGQVDLEATGLRNQFYPPAQSAVSTVEARIQFYQREARQPKPVVMFEHSVTLRAISPSPGSLLHNSEIGGFNMGEYADPTDPNAQRGDDVRLSPEQFLPPRAFYLVDDESRQLAISRYFRLGDFALDNPWFSLGKRQYIALDPGLVRKIEDLVDELKRSGLPGEKIRFICAFRPPSCTKGPFGQGGGEPLDQPFSLHLYGKAVDLVLDADGDQRLDDLDGDGRLSVRDTIPLIRCVNALDRRYRAQKLPLYGSLAVYEQHTFQHPSVRSPYVHIAIGGHLDQQGNLLRSPAKWPDTGEPIDWDKL